MLKDLLGALLLMIFAMGWLDFGQGSQYTWWSLIQYMGSNI